MRTIIGKFSTFDPAWEAAQALTENGIDSHYIFVISATKKDAYHAYLERRIDDATVDPTTLSFPDLRQEALHQAGWPREEIKTFTDTADQGETLLVVMVMRYQVTAVRDQINQFRPNDVTEKELTWRDNLDASSKPDAYTPPPTTAEMNRPSH